jgi:hypothetical protein
VRRAGWEKPWVEQIVDRIMKNMLKTTEERAQAVVSVVPAGSASLCSLRGGAERPAAPVARPSAALLRPCLQPLAAGAGGGRGSSGRAAHGSRQLLPRLAALGATVWQPFAPTCRLPTTPFPARQTSPAGHRAHVRRAAPG